jgi:hypothetical protein
VRMMSTQRFIHLRNLELLRAQLARTINEAKCQQIVRLIEDEELNGRTSADDHVSRRGSKTRNNARKTPRPAPS